MDPCCGCAHRTLCLTYPHPPPLYFIRVETLAHSTPRGAAQAIVEVTDDRFTLELSHVPLSIRAEAVHAVVDHLDSWSEFDVFELAARFPNGSVRTAPLRPFS